MVSSLLADHRVEVSQGVDDRAQVRIDDAVGYSRQLSCQIWSLDGELVGRSDGAPETRLTEGPDAGYSYSTVAGEPWRVYTILDTRLGLRVMVGDSIAVRDKLVRDVIEGLVVPGVVILPVLAALIWVSLGRGLGPLDQLAEILRRRVPQDLRPLPPTGPTPPEIVPVRQALDSLFSRLAVAREVERDFTTFAAHELKTPLAGLRTQAQVARLAPDHETRDKALRAIETSVIRTDRMVRQLLDLAEVDRTAAGRPAGVALSAAVEAALSGLAHLARDRGVALNARITPEKTHVMADPFLLQAALRNLAENAILASPHGETVEIEARELGGEVQIDVIDQGAGIPADLRNHVTDRFVRGAAGQGSGLGLSIVQSAVDRLGGRLRFPGIGHKGHIIRLILPLAPAGG